MEETYKLYTVILLLAATHFAQGFRVVSHFSISRHNRNVKVRLRSNVAHVPHGFSCFKPKRRVKYILPGFHKTLSTETRYQISYSIKYL